MNVRIEKRGVVAVLTLDRVAMRNAFDRPTVALLTSACNDVAKDASVRVILLESEGAVFSAGADLASMPRMAAASPQENLADARQLADLMHILDTCPKPTIARVQGLPLGGGVSLIACCDIALAADTAQFGLSEVRFGLIPAVIGPYVRRAVGARAARRLMLAADRIPAAEALRLGLVHEVAAPAALDAAVARAVANCLAGGPKAQAAAKHLIADSARPIKAALIEVTAGRSAAVRTTPEAAAGLATFPAKRKLGRVPE